MKQILITIDTEVGELGRTRADGFETFVEGIVDGQAYGYKKIIEMLDAHKASGEFFVDVYPTKQFGEERFATLCQTITKAGHGVQLHTHPITAFDEKRRYLKDYTLAEQEEIIALGMERIQKWTGVSAVAHRAGGYGANADSITALEKAGIIYDSSYHAENTHCELPAVAKNIPYKIGTLWEIPVTGYIQENTYHLLGIPLLKRTHFQKLDFRYGSTATEIQEAIRQAPDNSTQVIFLHSFNFLELLYNLKTEQFQPIRPLPNLIEEFSKLLTWLAEQPDYCFTRFNQLNLSELPADYLPVVPVKASLGSYASTLFAEKVRHTIKT